MPDSSVNVLIRWSFADILEMNRHYPRNRVGRRVCMALASIVLLAGIFKLVFHAGEGVLEILPYSPLILLVGLCAPYIAGCGAWAFKAKKKPYDLHVSAAGVSLDYEGAKLHLDWQRFNRFQETSQLLMLFTCRGLEMVSFPKRCFSQEELQRVRFLTAQHLGLRTE